MFLHAPVIILRAVFWITSSFRRVVGGAEKNRKAVVGDTFYTGRVECFQMGSRYTITHACHASHDVKSFLTFHDQVVNVRSPGEIGRVEGDSEELTQLSTWYDGVANK